jgi:predicted dehydrogenase
MPVTGQARWGIVGTARIAHKAFLPGLRAAGGVAAAVAGRDLARAQDYARINAIERAIEGYQNLIDDPGVDALYIPLPNGLHAQWTIQALRAGKPVLCEKPLCGTLAETERVLGVARETGTLLWEAFVFPFHAQMERIRALLTDRAIGELREIQSNFQFRLDRPDNIRWSRALDGGALNDLGCYPVRLARELFGDEHESAWATARWGGDGVDVDSQGSLGFPGDRRLLLSCGFGRTPDTFSRLMGTGGQIHVSNAFHPGPQDHFEVFTPGAEPRSQAAAGTEPSFAAAIAHIQAVLAGEQAPRSLAIDTSLGSARALHDLLESAAAAKAPELSDSGAAAAAAQAGR